MDSYLKAFDTESALLSIGVMMAVGCVVMAYGTRAMNRLEAKFATAERPAKPTSYGHLFWLGAMFLAMGGLPYIAKVNDLNRTPREVLQGEILEVDSVGGSQLLRISTSNNRLIKVVRPTASSWPTTPGPVQVELFHHGGREFVNDVQSQPEA